MYTKVCKKAASGRLFVCKGEKRLATGRGKKGTSKVTPLRRSRLGRFDINIGTILFGMIFIYLIVMFVVYLTRDKVTGYEVVRGALSGYYRYSALALKTEEVVKAEESGPITYYAREGVNVGSGELVCAIGQRPASTLPSDGGSEDGEASSVRTELSAEDTSDIKNMVSTFSANFRGGSFADVYDFKSNLESVILQSSIDENAGEYVSGSYQADSAGFVVYAVDGFEGVDESQLTQDMFSEKAYKKKSLRLNTSVSSGDDIFKLVTSENWDLYFPVDDKLRTQLDGMQNIRVRFLKDNSVFSAPFSIITGKDGNYGKISLSNSLVRFAGDRFLDIELILSKASGLKIPVSSIVSRDFYQIPAEYVSLSQKSEKEVFLQVVSFRKDGSEEKKSLTANIYGKSTEDNAYLVDASVLQDGDYVLMPGTTKKYEISEDVKKTIQGVYNINKGYAVFREVNIVDQNEEFCIVDPNNIYSLAAHDRIALDASQVKEDEIIV